MKTISASRANYKTLKKSYDKAVKEGKDSFHVVLEGEDAEFVTQYAKYLLQYMKSVMK